MSWRIEQIALMRAPRRLGKEQLALIRAPFKLCPTRLALVRPLRRGSLEEVTARVKRFVEGKRHDRHPTGIKYDPETGTSQFRVWLDGEWLDLLTTAKTDHRAFDTGLLLIEEFRGEDESVPPGLVEFSRWQLRAKRPRPGRGAAAGLARNLTIYAAVEALMAAGCNSAANDEADEAIKNKSACGLLASWGCGKDMGAVVKQYNRIRGKYKDHFGVRVLIDWLLGSGGPG